jgi:hypothetical protein
MKETAGALEVRSGRLGRCSTLGLLGLVPNAFTLVTGFSPISRYFNVFQLQYFHRMYSRLEKRKSVQKRMKKFSRRKIIWPYRCIERRPSSGRRHSPTRAGRAIVEDGARAPSFCPPGAGSPSSWSKRGTSFVIPNSFPQTVNKGQNGAVRVSSFIILPIVIVSGFA